jgi:hypothetical protein
MQGFTYSSAIINFGEKRACRLQLEACSFFFALPLRLLCGLCGEMVNSQ